MNQSGQSKFPFPCNFCKKKGHRAKNCRKKQAHQSGGDKKDSEKKNVDCSTATVTFLTDMTEADSITESETNNTIFALDSGASDHTSNDESQFSEFLKLKSPAHVAPADEDGTSLCTGVGNIRAKNAMA